MENATRIVEQYRENSRLADVAPAVKRRAGYTHMTDDKAVNGMTDKAGSAFADMARRDGSGQTAVQARPSIREAARLRMLVLDGAMGTMIQARRLKEADFRGERFAAHTANVSGCNDLLCLTRPDVILDIHRRYLDAGADIIETNTFNAQSVSMSGCLLEGVCREINLEACRIARSAADVYTRRDPSKPRFVAGSVGPTAKTCSVTAGTTQTGRGGSGYRTLLKAYAGQAAALIEGGVDALLIETISDTMNARAAIEAARSEARKAGRSVPLMLSFTIADDKGHNMLGQDICRFVADVMDDDILSVGVNCCSDTSMAVPLLARLGEETPCLISLYPNAGMPDAEGHYALTPEEMQRAMWNIAERHVLDIMGGCCGTTDAHIRRLTDIAGSVNGPVITPHNAL